MLFRTRTPSRIPQTIVSAIVCFGFVLQQLYVPVHLAWNDHVYTGARGLGLDPHGAFQHAGDGPGHEHEHPHHSKPEESEPGGHDPHSAADHLDQVADAAVPPTLVHVTLAPVSLGLELTVADASPRLRTDDVDSGPRAPPPRFAPPPRAPPIVL